MKKLTKSQAMVLKNQAMGESLKVLCICSVGCLRSPTIANYLYTEYDCNVRSCGVDVENALIPVSNRLVFWAKRLVFADMKTYLKFLDFGFDLVGKEIQILDIPDEFDYDSPKLINEVSYMINTYQVTEVE